MGATWNLLEEIWFESERSNIMSAVNSQPACTEVQIALVDVLKAWKIRPEAVVGHSSGEIAAANAAGALTQDECMRIAFHRGYVGDSLRKDFPYIKGSMLAVGTSFNEARNLTQRVTAATGYATVACDTSPKSVTISDDHAAIMEVEELAKAEGFFTRLLKVNTAYHSPHMARVADQYESKLTGLHPRNTHVKFFSSLTGSLIPSNSLHSKYWTAKLTNPVRYREASEDMLNFRSNEAPHVDCLIEIGPHPTLQGPSNQIMSATVSEHRVATDYYTTLGRQEHDVAAVMNLASTLHTKGYQVDLSVVNATRPQDRASSVLTDLPSYPWDHGVQYWHDTRIGNEFLFPKSPYHDLLGRSALSNDQATSIWRNMINTDIFGWVQHHRIQGDVIFPMSGYMCLAFEAKKTTRGM